MSTRSYSGTLIFENVFDAIPPSNTLLTNVANQVFNPRPTVIEEDCGTLLGEVQTLSFESEGLMSVVTGQRITRSFIENQLSQGVYEVQIRTLSTCISDGGICQKCYEASKPNLSVPPLYTQVQIPSEFLIQTEVISVRSGVNSMQLSYTQDVYDTLRVFTGGEYVPSSDYSIQGNVLTLNTPSSSDTYFTVRYFVNSRAPFFYWLAQTYGGSLLGLRPLPLRPLTLRRGLLTSLIPEQEVDSIQSKISANRSIPEEITLYLRSTNSLLEKSLLAIAVDSIYSNAQ